MNKLDKNKLIIFHQNIRSLRENWEVMCATLRTQNFWPDIIIVSEIWIFEAEVGFFNIENYDSEFNCNESYRAGGVAVFYKKGLRARKCYVSFNTADVLKIIIEGDVKISLLAVYRLHDFTIEEFNTELGFFLDRASKYKNLIILGDMNIDILPNSNSNVREGYLQILSSHGLECGIRTPTRVTETSISCLDHIFYRLPNIRTASRAIDNGITDHHSTLIEIQLKTELKFGRLTLNKSDLDLFFQEVGLLNLRPDSEDAEEAYNNFNSLINEALEKSIKQKTLKTKRAGRLRLSSSLQNQIKTKYQLLRKKTEIGTLSPEEKKMLKTLSKEIKHKVKKETKTYYENIILKAQGDTKALWKVINQISGAVRKEQHIELIDNGVNIVEKKAVADLLNDYFRKAPENLQNNLLKVPLNHPLSASLVCRHRNESFFIPPIVSHEIRSEIKKLKNNKGAGTDGITAEHLKKVVDLICEPLSQIFNLGFQQGVFPTVLKETNVIPIFKKGETASPASYRPINLISTCSKLAEKLMCTRLEKFLAKADWISPQQYGFRAGRSTNEALLEFSAIINVGINEGKKVGAILVDLAQAFQTVDHTILLNTLERAGVRGVARDWFHSYLTDRKQKVLNISNHCSLSLGTPQGGRLSPLLFIIYINDVCNYRFKGKVIAYADDIALVYSCDSYDQMKNEMNNDMRHLNLWFTKLKLTINVSKTVLITFSLSGDYGDLNVKSHNVNCINAYCNCENVIRMHTVKYLGVNFDADLKWNTHLQQLNRSCRTILRKFFHLKNYCSEPTLKLLYHSLFESRLSYGIHIWGGTYQTQLKNVTVTQKYIVRTILKKSRLTPSRPLFKQLQILPLRQLYIYRALRIFFNRCNQYGQKLPPSVYNTRNNNIFYVPKPKKTFFKKSFLYICPRIFNLLPSELKESNKLTKFSRMLKDHLLTVDILNF